MATLRRWRVQWSGGTGGAGVSTFYSGSAVDVSTELATFFGSIKSRFPSGIGWAMAGSGDTIDDATGHINGGYSGGTAWADSGSAGAVAYAGGVGTFVQWGTGAIVGTRRLKGRTFLTGLESVNYDSAGTIVSSCLTNLRAAAAVLAAAGKLVIWSRPDPGGSNGTSSLVTSGDVPDRVSWLQTRRS
jgi:hypothetical protein